MKKPSAETMKRRAMALGAKLDLSGNTFNASRAQAKVGPKPKAPPQPTQAPVPDKQPDQFESFAAATFMLADSTAQLVAGISQQLNNAPKSPAPAREWLFTVHRDKSGNMTNITATRKE